MNGGMYRSSNAYDYRGAAAEVGRRNNSEHQAQVHKQKRRLLIKAQEEQKALRKRARAKRLKQVTAICLGFACALLLVYRYVLIWESGANAENLKNTYRDVVAENDRIQAQINSSVDLDELERIAEERLGMIRPERYQMFYIDMGNNDHSEAVQETSPAAQEGTAPVAGVPGMLISAFELLK